MIGEFHVTVRFVEDGPAVTGTWRDSQTALRKFREWVGTHGSVEGVAIVLWEETAAARSSGPLAPRFHAGGSCAAG